MHCNSSSSWSGKLLSLQLTGGKSNTGESKNLTQRQRAMTFFCTLRVANNDTHSAAQSGLIERRQLRRRYQNVRSLTVGGVKTVETRNSHSFNVCNKNMQNLTWETAVVWRSNCQLNGMYCPVVLCVCGVVDSTLAPKFAKRNRLNHMASLVPR